MASLKINNARMSAIKLGGLGVLDQTYLNRKESHATRFSEEECLCAVSRVGSFSF